MLPWRTGCQLGVKKRQSAASNRCRGGLRFVYGSVRYCPLPRLSGRVLLIEWDAADWKVIHPMIERGEMPHLFTHGFMNFHPPQLPGVSDANFRLYSPVLTSAYRLHDAFLGRLLALAGPDTSVVLLSNHGFHSDHLRPLNIPRADPVAPAYQHRPHGILVLAGPGVGKDVTLHGAGVLDVTPTVLTMLRLPVGRDMPGRVLAEAFRETPKTGHIPSWERIHGADGRHPPDLRAAPSG